MSGLEQIQETGSKGSEKPLSSGFDSVSLQINDTILSHGFQQENSTGLKEFNEFGLTPEDVRNIETQITANLPLGGPAMIKLLTALGYTNVTSREAYGKLKFGINEYEVISIVSTKGDFKDKEFSVVLMPNYVLELENTDMVHKTIDALRLIFPEKNIVFTLESLSTSVDTHGICPVCRADDGHMMSSIGSSAFASAWIETKDTDKKLASSAFRDVRSRFGFKLDYDRSRALSLVPSFV